MARFQLLIPLILWAIWLQHGAEPVIDPVPGSILYAVLLGVVVLLMRKRAWRAMERTTVRSSRAIGRYHQWMFAARWVLMGIHAGALFWLGWGHLVAWTGITFGGRVETLGALVSSLPVAIAWVGLIWAQYPLDRAVREQNALLAINAGESVYAPPSVWEHVSDGTRATVLTTLVPIIVAYVLHDAILLIARRYIHSPSPDLDIYAGIAAALLLAVFWPVIFRRVLPLQRLPDSPLRERLEAMCRRLGLRYHDILLWRTHHSICNAAVTGLLPRFRYVLLTDLLIDTLSDEQIEAVFAHEAGHVVHRHMAWYAVFLVVFVLWLSGAETLLSGLMERVEWSNFPLETTMAVLGFGSFVLIFGLLSRSFERQADLFAARNLAIGNDRVGIEVFTSALESVARINNMPLDAAQMSAGQSAAGRAYAVFVHYAATWLHGSIRSRLEYLRSLPLNPDRSQRFDRSMTVIRFALLMALLSSAAWIVTSIAL